MLFFSSVACFLLQGFWKNRSMSMTTRQRRKRNGSIIHVSI